jgi:hypothetical protein
MNSLVVGVGTTVVRTQNSTVSEWGFVVFNGI